LTEVEGEKKGKGECKVFLVNTLRREKVEKKKGEEGTVFRKRLIVSFSDNPEA